MIMTARQKIRIASAAIALLAGIAVYLGRHAARQREQLLAALTRQTDLAADLESARKNSARLAEALAAPLVAGSVTAESSPAAANPAATAIAADAKAWLSRVVELRGMFARNPAFAIPELSLLTELQWIQAARTAEFETPEQVRKSLAAVRTTAKEELNGRLASAFQRYIGATAGRLPPTIADVLPYFVRPVDPAMFDRYEMAPVGTMKELPPGTLAVIREKAPVDEDFDVRMYVDRTGRRGSAGGGARAWLDAPDGYRGLVARAQGAYARVHPGAKGAGLEQLAPYIDPPLPPEKLKKLIELERTLGP